jgi:hypothetical protein
LLLLILYVASLKLRRVCYTLRLLLCLAKNDVVGMVVLISTLGNRKTGKTSNGTICKGTKMLYTQV